MWYLGIDGGGTHTRIEVRDGENRFIRRAEFGAFNLNSVGEEAFRRLLREIFASCGGLSECGGICAGGAGVSNPRARELFAAALSEAGCSGPWKLCGDQEIALRGAMDGPGVILISGTGSICFGKNAAGETRRSGGYGHLIDDGGSGYFLGREALSAAVRSVDGRRGGSAAILDEVCRALDITTPEELVAWVYSPKTDKSAVARLSNIVLELAGTDAAARDILHRGAEELYELVEAAQRALGIQGGDVALLGGLLTADNAYRRVVADRLSELGSVVEPKHDALWGAAQMAYEL